MRSEYVFIITGARLSGLLILTTLNLHTNYELCLATNNSIYGVIKNLCIHNFYF